MEEPATRRTPWHLWVIGLVSLIWNSGGAYDYVMTQTGNMDYLAAAARTMDVPVAMVVDFFGGFPAWADAFWAFGVWGAMAGSLLLLLRSRYAQHAFITSLIGLIGTTAYTATSDMAAEMITTFSYIFSAVIVIVTLLLIWYARRMGQAGVLR